MKPVFQTITTRGKGNCYAACLASLLEIPLERVPNFRCLAGESVRDFNDLIQDYLARFNLFLLRVRMADAEGEQIDFPFHPLPEGAHCIGTGKSPRGLYNHAVVGTIAKGLNFQMTHDPHRSGDGITSLATVDFLLPKNPAGAIRKIFVGD